MWGMAKITYTTITDVPLIRVGQWNPAEGSGEVTLEMLEQVTEAAQDVRLNLPVIKIGHVDQRFDNPDYFDLDGEPAYGQVNNIRLTDEQDGTLVGDFINVPEDLADKMASAYPHRSVEIAYDVELLDPDGKTIETFPAVLTAVALLGSAEPAVSGLGAIHESFTKGKPVKVGKKKHMESFSLAAGHTFGTLRRALEQLLTATVAANTYLWVADLDDEHVIYEVETDNAHRTFQQGYVVDQSGSVSLNGDAVEVVRQTVYTPVEGNTVPVPQAAFSQDNPDGVKPSTPVAAPTPSHKEEDPMLTDEQIAELRAKLGIPEAVTDDEIRASLTPVTETTDEPAEAAGEETSTDGTETADVVEEQEAAAPLAASKAPELPATVSVSAAAFTQMQTQNKDMAERLARIEAKEAAERRDKVIAAAFKSGRLHPTEKAAFREALDKDEETVTRLLESRHPAFPTTEIGATGANFSFGDDTIRKAQADIDSKLFGRAGK